MAAYETAHPIASPVLKTRTGRLARKKGSKSIHHWFRRKEPGPSAQLVGVSFLEGESQAWISKGQSCYPSYSIIRNLPKEIVTKAREDVGVY